MMVGRHILRGKTKQYAGENLFNEKDKPPSADERRKREAYIARARAAYNLLMTKPRNKYAQILGVELNTTEEGNEP
jgi:hypothetical protein